MSNMSTAFQRFSVFPRNRFMALQANLWRAIGQNPTEADLKRIIDENDTGTGHFQLETWF